MIIAKNQNRETDNIGYTETRSNSSNPTALLNIRMACKRLVRLQDGGVEECSVQVSGKGVWCVAGGVGMTGSGIR